MMGFSVSEKTVNCDVIRPLIDADLDKVLVEEFSQSVTRLGLLKELSFKDGKVIATLVLPTFALKSEAQVAMQVKAAIMEHLPSSVKVDLNVYADVRPVTTQSVLTPEIADVRNIILVASGKGGVGKSTVASNLAASLAKLGCRVGFLDADVYGPSAPTMFGLSEQSEIRGIGHGEPEQVYMLPLEQHGVKVMSLGFLVDTSSAMIWRGPMIAQACMQLFQNVAWGELDYLIVDLPPGTGDIQLTISQKIAVAGAIVVSTPQDVALADVVRAKAMFDKVGIPIMGIVENMSYFVCDGCDKRHEIFTHGGAKATAERLAMPFLAELPLEAVVRAGSDAGSPVVLSAPESATAKAFKELAHAVAAELAHQVITHGEAVPRQMPKPETGKKPHAHSHDKPAKKGSLPVVM